MVQMIIIWILSVLVILLFIYAYRLHVVLDNFLSSFKEFQQLYNKNVEEQNKVNKALWTYIKTEKTKLGQSIKELQKFILRISKGDRKVVKNEIEKIVKEANDEKTNN